VHLAAPGSGIVSTTPNNTYSSFNGTSMATPHVAGAMALVWSQDRSQSYSEVIRRILDNVDVLSSLEGRVITGGRLNVARAMITAPQDTTGPRVVSAVPNSPTLPDRVRLTFSEPIDPATFTLADISGFVGPNGVTVTPLSVVVVPGTDNTQFDVTFSTPTIGGSYRFDVGPDITDLAGNRWMVSLPPGRRQRRHRWLSRSRRQWQGGVAR
jgi:subtilisin family serine protease